MHNKISPAASEPREAGRDEPRLVLSEDSSQTLRRYPKTEALVLFAIVVVGALHLPQPFYDDQALFTIGAQGMSQGQILYRDFWDIKQPGIFVFYLIAGRMFGFTEVGAHALELLYLTGLSLMLMITLRRYYQQLWLAAVVPLLTVGVYYGVSGITQLGQVEGLVWFPMFLCLWFAWIASQQIRGRRFRLLLSGFMGGVALLFKLMFLPMVISFWVLSLVDIAKGEPERRPVAALAGDAFVIGCGLLFPFAITLVYFLHRGAGSELLYTWFVYPVRAVIQLPHQGPGHFFSGVLWFASHSAPLLALGLIGAIPSPVKQRDRLSLYFVLWFVIGVVVILLQRRSWNPYHYMLLLFPTGVLAVKGIEVLWQQLKGADSGRVWQHRHNLVLVVGIALLFSPLLISLLIKGLVLCRYHLAVNKEERLKYQGDSYLYPNSLYPEVLAEVEFLSHSDAQPGEVAVIGNPMFYLLSGRHPATAFNAGFENFLPEQWRTLEEQLTHGRPPYVFIAAPSRELVKEQAGDTLRFIEANYRAIHTSNVGMWYLLAQPVSAAQSR